MKKIYCIFFIFLSFLILEIIHENDLNRNNFSEIGNNLILNSLDTFPKGMNKASLDLYNLSVQNIPLAIWDEQVGITFDYGSSILKWNVTAIAQNDSYGYGPAYLLNGLTDQGWWYQVGIAYNWPLIQGGYVEGFYLLYEIWNNSGYSVFPQNGAGIQAFNGMVHSGDLVELRLMIQNNEVILSVYDWNTKASASISYPLYGSKFVGSLDGNYNIVDKNGYFTGLMTEQYHVNPYYGDIEPVFYKAKSVRLNSVWLWMDEFNPNTKEVLFAYARRFDLRNYPNAFYGYYHQGLGQYVAGNRSGYAIYITGSKGIVAANFAYRVIGGGTGYSSPTLSIIQNNTETSIKLNNSLYGVIVKEGAYWHVDEVLNGSKSLERWATNKNSGYLINKIQDIIINYYHQFYVNFFAEIMNGGKPEISIKYISFGEVKLGFFNFSTFVDAGTNYTIQKSLVYENERWITDNRTEGLITNNANIHLKYFHQFRVQFLYKIHGSNNTFPPKVIFMYLGKLNSTYANITNVWVDSFSEYEYQALLNGSNDKERWIAINNSGRITEPSDISVDYFHQFYVEIRTNYEKAGSLNLKSGWYNESQQLNIIANPNPGWILYGWIGYGNGAYNGSGTAKIIVNGPIKEIAIFYAIIRINIEGQGTVIYLLGENQGQSNNKTLILYAPPNSTLILKASPNGDNIFSNWEIDGKIINEDQISITINGPIEAKIIFKSSFNYLYILTILIFLFLIIIIYIRWKTKR